MEHKYEVIVYWSQEDDAFLAEVPELPGCIGHGKSQHEAIQAVNIVVKEWIALAQENGWAIPEPKGRLMYA